MSEQNFVRIGRRYPLYAVMFLLLLIAADAGLILGAVFAAAILPALASVIAAGATLAAVVVAVLIFWRIRG